MLPLVTAQGFSSTHTGSWKLQLHDGSSLTLQKGRGVNMHAQRASTHPWDSGLLSAPATTTEEQESAIMHCDAF